MNERKLKKRKRILKFILLIVIVFLFYIGYLFFNSPKIKMLFNIYNFTSQIKQNNQIYDDLFNNSKINLDMNTTIRLNDSLGLSEQINPVSLSINYYEDNDKKNNYIDLSSSIKYKKLLTLKSINKDNKLYFNIDNSNDYYYVDSTYLSLFKNNNLIDSNIKKALIKTIMSEISNNSFSKSSEEDIINDNNVVLNKVTLTLNNNNLLNIINVFKINLSEYNTSGKYNYIIENINNYLDNYDKTKNINFKYNYYTLNDNIVRQDLQIINYENEEEQNIILALYDYDNKNGIRIINNGEDILNIIFTKSEDNTEINGKYLNNTVVGKLNSDKIVLNVSDEKQNKLLDIDGDITRKKIKENEKYTDSYKINVLLYDDNKVILNSTVTSNIKFNANIDVPEININETKNLNEIFKNNN